MKNLTIPPKKTGENGRQYAYRVLYQGASAKDAVLELLHRRKTSEQEDAGWL